MGRRQRHTGRMSRDDRGRDWGDTAASQKHQGLMAPEASRGRENSTQSL